MRIFFILFSVLVAASVGPRVSADGLTARVKTINGIPRLVVNGLPVRPRLFWGETGPSPIAISGGRQSLSFTFSPMLCEPSQTTLQFHFQHVASKILIESVRLLDLTTGADVIPATRFGDKSAFKRDWDFQVSSAPDGNGSVNLISPDSVKSGGGVELAQWNPAAGHDWRETCVFHKPNLSLNGDHRYRFDMTLSSEAPTIGYFTLYRPRLAGAPVFLGGVRAPFGDQISMASKSGVNMISFETDLPWAKPSQAQDTEYIDAVTRYILHTNPNALILPRLDVRPPSWWLDAHPGDEMRWIGQEKHPRTPTVASQTFLNDASSQLASLIRHLEATFGDHILGYHIAGQNTDEWFYQDSWGNDWNGYADADTAAFRHWLIAKYMTDGALKSAWHNEDVSLANAAVPTPDERQAGHADLRDPAAMQSVIDFTLFQQDSMADCICRMAHTVRQTTAAKKLSVFFYGYTHEFGGMQNGPANSGHYALRRVLDSPDIDCIASPWSYIDRGLAGAGPIMVAADSCALAGKLCVTEDDTRTHLSAAKEAISKESLTEDGTVNVLLRNASQVALRNIATWWADLGSGWFDDPAYWKALDAFYPVEKSQLDVARPYHPEIALVVDENSVPLLAWHGRAGNLLFDSQTVLGRSGAPYGQYLQDDISAGRVHAKVYVFVSSYRLTASKRSALLKSTKGATRIWCYAPGYYDGGAVSLAAVKDLTGFEVKTVSPDRDRVTPTAAGIKLGLTDSFGVNASLHPTLSVADARDDEALATYPDGSVAVAIRKTSSGTSIFVGTPQLSIQLLRLAARTAGAHLYADNDAAVFANGPFLAVHATRGGPIAIDTGKASEIVDVIGGERLGKGPKVTIDISAGETRVMRY